MTTDAADLGYGYTKEQLTNIAVRMRVATEKTYPLLAATGCHPFIEFNGLMHKFVDLCERAVEKGVVFPMANEHTGIPLPVELHDIEYMAEKLRCIFGPIIDSNDEARRALFRHLFGSWRP